MLLSKPLHASLIELLVGEHLAIDAYGAGFASPCGSHEEG
jgi:hypothetical protein